MKQTRNLAIALALWATAIAAAQDTVDVDASAEDQVIEAGASPTDPVSEDMAHFLAIVADVLAENDDIAADAGAPEESVVTAGVIRKHLGLGFSDTPLIDPTVLQGGDHCRGSGHAIEVEGVVGYRDCGDPSPSD